MLCFNCKKQIADDSQVCPECGVPIIPQFQLQKEIKLRRYQRWVFYALLAVVFLGMTAFAAKIYMDNTEYTKKMTELAQNVTDQRDQLKQKDSTISSKDNEIAIKVDELTKYTQQVDQLKQDMISKDLILGKYSQVNLKLDPMNLALYQLAANAYVVSSTDLMKISVADFNLANGIDTDKDGLADNVEAIFGTDATKADMDGDTYTDKAEILAGFDPLTKTGKLPIDLNFTNASKGKFLKDAVNNYVWYISPVDGKSYFLGNPGNVMEAINVLSAKNQ